MINLAEAFEKMADSPLLFAVIGRHYNARYSDPSPEWMGKLLPWSEARPYLDYQYDNGFGSAECHPVYAWTEMRVLFVHEYDGATGVDWLPRQPSAGVPEFGGYREREVEA